MFQSPEGHPNGLEATEDGLWVGEQVTDRVHLLDWESGRPLVSYETQSSNTSGIAAGNGLVFVAANGPGKLRPRRPHDVTRGGRIVKMNAKTGEHIQNFQTPSGGGLHGLLWAKDFLWITQFNPRKIVKADADINVFHDFDTPLPRAHGLGWTASSSGACSRTTSAFCASTRAPGAFSRAFNSTAAIPTRTA